MCLQAGLAGRNLLLQEFIGQRRFRKGSKRRPPHWRAITAEELAPFQEAGRTQYPAPAHVLEFDPDPLEGAPLELLLKVSRHRSSHFWVGVGGQMCVGLVG